MQIDETLTKIMYVAVGGAGIKVVEKLRKNMPEIRFVEIDGALQPQTEMIFTNEDNDVDMVIIVTGLGGKAGADWCSRVGDALKKRHIFTVVIATFPFGLEGEERADTAFAALKTLLKDAVPVILLKNDNVLECAEKGIADNDAFVLADDFVLKAIHGVTGMIVSSGDNDISIDMEDIQYILEGQNVISIGFGKHDGENAVSSALLSALESPLLDGVDFNSVSRIMIHFDVHPDRDYSEIFEAKWTVFKNTEYDAVITFATSTNEAFAVEHVEATVVLNDFRKAPLVPANNVDYKCF